MTDKPKSKRYGFNKPGQGPGFDYWWNAEEVPDDIPRYKGELVYCAGQWGSARLETWVIPEGGFAVEGPKRYTCWDGTPAQYGDWTIFGPDGGKSLNMLPWSLVKDARVEELPNGQ
jgi:hypothetical protein